MTTEGSTEFDGHKDVSQTNITPSNLEPAKTPELSMYEIPGQDSINQHTHERYLRAKDRWDKQITALALEQKEREQTLEHFSNVPENERTGTIRKYLQSNNPYSQTNVVKKIDYAPVTDRPDLIREAFNSRNPAAQINAAQEIRNVASLERPSLKAYAVAYGLISML